MSSDHTQKRKRPAAKPVSKSKRLKRAAAYHSSSSEDEDDVGLVVNVDEMDDLETNETRSSSNVKEVADDSKEVGASSARGLEGEARGSTKSLVNGKSRSKNGATSEAVKLRTVNGAKDDPPESDSDSKQQDDSHDDEETSSSSSLSSSTHPTSATNLKPPKSNRHSPAHFAASLSTILSSKLTTSQRADPLLSRSVDAAATARAKNDSLLELAARRKMRADKVAGKEKGRVRDVLGTGTRAEMDGKDRALSAEKSTGLDEESVQETERRLKRTAQRGVVKLFNAVRAAQVGAAEAGEMSKREGTVGVERRKERVDEMSRKGFLEMLSGGG